MSGLTISNARRHGNSYEHSVASKQCCRFPGAHLIVMKPILSNRRPYLFTNNSQAGLPSPAPGHQVFGELRDKLTSLV